MVTAGFSVSLKSFWPYFLFAMVFFAMLALIAMTDRSITCVGQKSNNRFLTMAAVSLTIIASIAAIMAVINS